MSGRPARVRGRSAFQALARTGRRARSGPVTVHFVPTDSPECRTRVAYAVGRKVGTAVVRNLWRRRLRAVVAEISSEFPPGTYLVGVSREVEQLSFAELRERVEETMRRATGGSK